MKLFKNSVCIMATLLGAIILLQAYEPVQEQKKPAFEVETLQGVQGTMLEKLPRELLHEITQYGLGQSIKDQSVKTMLNFWAFRTTVFQPWQERESIVTLANATFLHALNPLYSLIAVHEESTNKVIIINFKTGEKKLELTLDPLPAIEGLGFLFDATGHRLIISQGHILRVWDIFTGKIWSKRLENSHLFRVKGDATGTYISATFTFPDESCRSYLLDAKTGSLLATFNNAFDFYFNATGSYAAYIERGQPYVTFVRLKDQHPIRINTNTAPYVVLFNAQGTQALIIVSLNKVIIVDLENETIIKELTFPDDFHRCYFNKESTGLLWASTNAAKHVIYHTNIMTETTVPFVDNSIIIDCDYNHERIITQNGQGTYTIRDLHSPTVQLTLHNYHFNDRFFDDFYGTQDYIVEYDSNDNYETFHVLRIIDEEVQYFLDHGINFIQLSLLNNAFLAFISNKDFDVDAPEWKSARRGMPTLLIRTIRETFALRRNPLKRLWQSVSS